ncbi:MAG: hypothetical protein ILP10_08740, partial [Lachnospiraceae bacterium]|nr:hypothetical protein [Lachnospiraceae bacterium]
MSTEKKRWLGKALLLALACLAFIWAGKDSTALADDPEGEAIAKLIYASETDEEGNPTGNTSYRFMEDVPDESWSPYAVFVRPATGPAITLEDGRFEGVDYTAVRIWNNDCHVLVEADWVDREKLVLAGDGSYLDVGWSHFQHGQCEADAYNGADDAEDIAAYFNSFVYGDEYYNDESVFMGFDENLKEINPDDPHFNKAVYTIDWDMAVAGLTLEDNVVAFIQDDGAIHISGSIRLGNGAMIEAVDDTPRLFIDTDDASAIDLDLYDYLGAGGETPLTSNVASVYYYTEKEIGGTPTLIWTRVPEDFGREDVKQAAKKYIYAYARLDYDQDNDSDEDDLKLALAAELAWKFRVYGPFGLYDNYDGATEEIWGNLLHDAEILARRIELEGTSPINAIDSEGQNEEIARYVATINWGHTITGTEIQSTVYLYQLTLPEELLICTDFNESTGMGNSFYVRKDFEDKRILIGDVNNPPASVDEDFFSTVLVVNSFSNVAAGGNGVAMEVKNRDNNLLTFQTIAYYLMKHKEGDSIHNLNTATTVKIFKSGGRFFAVSSEGEAKRHDYVTHETGGVADKVWEAGGRYPVK